jgi:hypothetical protein
MTMSKEQQIAEPETRLPGTPAPQSVAAPSAGKARGPLRRARTFAKEHPVLLLSGAAAVAVIAGVEGAAAVMLGMGIAALFGRKRGSTRAASAAEAGPSPGDLHPSSDTAPK